MTQSEHSNNKNKTAKPVLKIIIPAIAVVVIAILIIVIVNAAKGKKDKSGETVTATGSSQSTLVTDNSTTATTSEGTGAVQTTDNTDGAAGDYLSYSVDGLSLEGDGYEGTEGTGNYNYGEALQKSILFYELQRSGELPDTTRCNWRGDSCLNDGADAGLDLTGGWFDAGDNCKFNLPMAYTASMLCWSLYEDYDAYEESGQLDYQLNNIKYVCDYFIKCHPSDEVYYYQVGDGSQDHSWWGPAELVETRMSRNSYCVTASNPGSCVTGETAAALASASIIFADSDPDYSALCLKHAESLYAFAAKYKSDSGYTQSNGFYTSNSGFYDELVWAAVWLYIATGDNTYLTDAENFYPNACQDYNWSVCWDDVHIAAALLLARITEKDVYSDAVEENLDWWTTGTASGDRITYTPKGLAWLDSWGSLRYATTMAFVAAVYSEWEGCDEDKVDTYWDFAVSQADYALGSTGKSFMVGFGDNYPQHIHHRTAQGSYSNNMNEPATARHVLVGALVGGPDASDGYTDEVSNYNTNEVACDYNAGFTGLLAKLYTRYHGQTVVNLGAVEQPQDEFFSEASINVNGNDFVEIKAYVYNETAWPARGNKDLELRYYVDLSEVYEAGGSVSDIQITTNYVQSLLSTEMVTWDEDTHIYYLSVKFIDGEVYPGGQENYRKEVQVRMRNVNGVWDNSNDYSYQGLNQGSMTAGTCLALYEEGELVYGSEPAAGSHAGQSAVSNSGTGGNSSSSSNQTSNSSGSGQGNNSSGSSNTVPVTSTAKQGDLDISVEYSATGNSVNSIAGTMTIKNSGSGTLALKDLKILYYFTNETGKTPTFSCYYAGIQGSTYSDATSGFGAAFTDTKDNDSDTLCTISYSGSGALAAGDTLQLNFCITADWAQMDMTNDYSAKAAENIELKY